MQIVIGSGPAGVACAAALLAHGLEVMMLDAGLRLEPEREALRAGMAGKPQAAWSPAERALVAPPAGNHSVPDKLSYGSDYPYRGSAPGSLRGSFAQGGLSNVWGGAVMPYRKADMAGWPVTDKDLAPGYRAVLKLMPYAARADALAEEWPLYGEAEGMMPASRQAARMMAGLERNADALRARGVRFGGARLAVQAAPCIRCGACLNGCPLALIYSARENLPKLRNAGAVYIPGMTVKAIEETAEGVRVLAVDEAGGRREFKGARVFLAAGVLNSAEILLRSLKQERAVLLDSQYFLMPWVQFSAAPDVRAEALHTMAQVFLEIDDPAISPYGVHLQVYGYNDILLRTLEEKLGPLARFGGPLLDRMLIIQGYLHSAHSGRIEVRLENDRLVATPAPGAEAAKRVRLVVKKLAGLARLTGAVPAWPLLQVTEPGRGFHAGGSFPMARSPAAGQTDIWGRPFGRQRTHVVDASVFPSIAATTITLTAMANAWRIGDRVGAMGDGFL